MKNPLQLGSNQRPSNNIPLLYTYVKNNGVSSANCEAKSTVHQQTQYKVVNITTSTKHFTNMINLWVEEKKCIYYVNQKHCERKLHITVTMQTNITVRTVHKQYFSLRPPTWQLAWKQYCIRNAYLPGIKSVFPLQFNLTLEESQSTNLQSLRRLHTFLKYFLTHDKAGVEILTIYPQKQSSSPRKGTEMMYNFSCCACCAVQCATGSSHTPYGTTSTSTAGLNSTESNSHITHDMLPQHLINYNEEKSLNVLNCNFSKEQRTLPEDDRMIETCRSVLSVLM